ncbi:MAG: hypothetical protein A2038_15845 [Deltaproteobacteria bacterium GWA2_57_13]|nr:MAG: hypothetical protein A2038_15845 [Deltaproteobacteria bacterium GWA2_57_13]OGQ73869.1 MAG: hypothetical protein A3G40_11850 [Deltaproteobacteria bacterium RIFCSPLOWO2_12_FULL_57_22]
MRTAITIEPVLRIELWHGLLLLALWLIVLPLGLLDPAGLFLGGLFMGVNFVLLGLGIRYLLTPFAERRRVRTGIFLLVLKLVLFLGLLSALFVRLDVDPASFAVGVTCLLLAVLAERGWAHLGRKG